jgi:putative SOS response-associated peptidase YedK
MHPGLWHWKDPATRQWIRTFAIISIPANDIVATIHDRMPAILDKVNFPRWFGDEADPSDLLVPYPSDMLAVKAIGKRS